MSKPQLVTIWFFVLKINHNSSQFLTTVYIVKVLAKFKRQKQIKKKLFSNFENSDFIFKTMIKNKRKDGDKLNIYRFNLKINNKRENYCK